MRRRKKKKNSDQIVQDNIDPVQQEVLENVDESEIQDISALPKIVQKQKKISNFFFKTSFLPKFFPH